MRLGRESSAVKPEPRMKNRLISTYEALLAGGTIAPDAAQSTAVSALQRLADTLERYRPNSAFGSFLGFGRRDAPTGLYIYGAVGRGKTMLMDLFFRNLAIKSKRRLHFDAFMAEAHAAIETAREAGTGDPIPGAARAIARKGLLICLDEFQVNDIADAMILSRLFEALFAEGAVLITTSNTAPNDLYRDGLNRPLFLPFVRLLTERTATLELLSAQDYRMRKLMGRRLYFTPADAVAAAGLTEAWSLLTGGADGSPRSLDVQGHKLRIPRAAEGTAWMTFAELCGQPLWAADYRALAANFHTLILESIPVLSPEQRNEARRFILLIDALYDLRIRLIASAAAEPGALYPQGDGAEAFGRTASRLVEMRSQDYLEASRPQAVPVA